MGVTVAVTRVAANTSIGNQTISTNDLGGLTPKAVLLIATRGVTDGTAADGAGWYMGGSDGTNEWAHAYEHQHAQATMDTQSNQDATDNRILTIYDSTADSVVEATADFVSFQADGVTIDWTDAPASEFLITAIFFAGTDLTAAAFTQDLGNTANALIDITSIGFEADVVITTWNHTTSPGNQLNLGLIHNDRGGTVTQRCFVIGEFGSSTSTMGMQVRDGEFLYKFQTSGAADYWGTAQSFDSSGFSVQLANSRSPGNADISGIALRFGTSPVVSSKVYAYSTPTSTGANTDSNPGFEPQFVLYLPNRAAAFDTSETDADSGAVGLLVVDVDELYTNSIGIEDGAADSNTQSVSDDKLNLPTHTGASGHEATLTSMGSTGPVWNFSATDGTARLWPALAIQKFTEAGGDSIIHPIFANDEIHGVIFGGQVVR